MSKNDKKSKREKKELDLILAQLKKSYNEDSSSEIENDDSYDSNDNAEFNEILEKLFASTSESPTKDEDRDKGEDTSYEDPSDEADVELDEHSEETEKDSFENAPSLFDKSVSENQSESDVDGVLQLMFANNAQKADTVEAEIPEEPDRDEFAVDEVIDDLPPVDSYPEIEDIPIDDQVTLISDEYLINEDIIYEKLDDPLDLSSLEASESPECAEDIYDDEYLDPYEDESLDMSVFDEDKIYSEEENAEFAVSDEEYDDTYEIEQFEEPVIIFDPALYTFDPLQDQLPEFSTLNVEETDVSQAPSSDVAEIPASKDIAVSEAKDQFNENDISLLLKFGYGEEVKSKIGEEEAQKVIAEKNGSFHPESHKIPYGFCGKEFSDRSEAQKIKEKFKSDKNLLILQLILVSLVTAGMLALEFFFEFISDRSSYLVVIAVEFILIAVTFLILYKKIVSGILGIVRFEANLYSILAYLIFAYALCNIATTLTYIINQPMSDTSGFMVFGFCIMLYTIFVLIAELLNCLKDAATFDLMCRSESFYTAERHTVKSSDNVAANVGIESNISSYRLTKTSLISGYFRKASKSISGNTNLIYIIGIVPIISLVVGCTSAIVSENVMSGVFSMMITTLLCTPFAYILLPSVTEYLSSLSLKKKKIAFIGSDAPKKLAKADSLFFDDTNAIEIISYTEIHPTKSQDGQRMLDIAKRVFKSLDGPLGEFTRLHEDHQAGGGVKSEVVINSISDNGIEIYFESSINILIGDKSYMQSHNIKVKTDSNLNTAIKGFDRSVIYMAFDGTPKLGFIITSKVKPEFSSVVSMLDENGIRVFVDTYEPQINDIYFEQNKADDSATVSVCKSEEYESTDYKPVCDGNVVCSSDSFALADAIVECRKIVAKRKKIQRLHLILVLGGIIISCLLTALLNVDQTMFILGGLKSHVSLVLNVIMILGLIPCAVSIIKARKQNHKQKQDNAKEKK